MRNPTYKTGRAIAFNPVAYGTNIFSANILGVHKLTV